jgi:enoyl-CoA hydratase/carnithine racemase
MPDVLYEKRDNYAIFTLNRPERLNAMGGNMAAELDAAVADFTADPHMRVGILTGAGRAFSAGGDLRQMAEGTFKPWPQDHWYAANPRPFIAAINGLAVGGGFEQALDCDIRICSTEAYFGLMEVKRGIMAGYAARHLAHVIGMSATNYILLTGDRVSPEQALQWGIVTEVVSPDRLLPRAIEIAQTIAANAPLSVEGTKASIQMWRQSGLAETTRMSQWVSRAVSNSEDSKEGPRAFAEKRAPQWQGR